MRHYVSAFCGVLLASTLVGCCVPVPMCMRHPADRCSPAPLVCLAPPPFLQPGRGSVACAGQGDTWSRPGYQPAFGGGSTFGAVNTCAVPRDCSCSTCGDCGATYAPCDTCGDATTSQPVYEQPYFGVPAESESTFESQMPVPDYSLPSEPVPADPVKNSPLPPATSARPVRRISHSAPQQVTPAWPPQPRAFPSPVQHPSAETAAVPGRRVQWRKIE